MNQKIINNYRENNQLEIKKATGGIPKSIWETVSSFANTSGGLIILGLEEKDDGTYSAVDIDVQQIEKLFWDNMNNKTKVSSNFLKDSDFSKDFVDGKEIILIRIPRANRRIKPIYINGDIYNGTFKRNHEGDYHCTVDEINTMIAESTGVSLDTNIVIDYDPSNLSKETIKTYRGFFNNIRPTHDWIKLDDSEFLLRIGALKKIDNKYVVSEAGLLFFGHDWEINQYFPYYLLDYRYIKDFSLENRWEERIVTGFGECEAGNIFEFFLRVINAINSRLKTPFAISEDGYSRIDDTKEKKIIREALINALTNADYKLPRAVKVLFDNETLVVENPGRYLVDVESALRGGKSEPRNQTIMRIFNAIGFGDQAGYGVSTINDYVENQLNKVLTIKEEVEPDRSIMIIPLIKNEAEKNASLNDFLQTLVSGQSFNVGEAKEYTKLPKSTLNYQINKAVKLGQIRKGKKNGIYIKI